MALLAALFFLVRLERGAVAPRAQTAAAVPSAEPVEPQPPVALPPPAPTRDEERASIAPTAPVPTAPLAPKACEIRGRFVLSGGAPAVGAHYEIHGWEKNDDEVQLYGRPDHWDDLTGETDADGRLSERFEPPRAYQFTLEVTLAVYAGAEWRWREILAGAVIDVGEIELVRGGAIEGRIVDAEGDVVPGQWMVYAESAGLRERDGRDETTVMEPARLDGSFRVEDVRPGRVELKAHGDDWTEGTIVQVRSGEIATADIVTKRREAATRISLVAAWAYSGALGAEPEHVSLTGPDGTVRRLPATRSDLAMGRFAFDDLSPGEYRLAIDDPRFQPVTRVAEPGETVEVELEGTAALQLFVRGADGKPSDFHALGVELRNVNFSPHSFEVPAETMHLQHDRLGGLVPGDYRLTVRAGERVGSMDVDGLAPGETRSLELRVAAPRTIRGVVRYSDGAAAAGVDVALLTADDAQHGAITRRRGGDVRFADGVEHGTTDELGEFRLAVARAGEYVVQAIDAGEVETTSGPIRLEGADLDGIELVLPRGGFVVGRVLAPPGASLSGMSVWASGVERRRLAAEARELDAEGRFELGPLLPGTTKIHLQLPQQMRRVGKGHYSGGRGAGVEIGQVEIVDGGRVERDFTVDWPGTVVLTVLVNGEALAGLSVHLASAPDMAGEGVNGETDTRGETDPLLAFAGSWTVSVRDVDAGWRYEHPTPVVVASARESRAQIAVQVSEATLQFLDAQSGKPLARQWISLLGPHADWRDGFARQRKKTDTQGRTTWTLATGEYRFRLDPEGEEFPFFPDENEPAAPARLAPLSWTLEGPLTHEVRL